MVLTWHKIMTTHKNSVFAWNELCIFFMHIHSKAIFHQRAGAIFEVFSPSFPFSLFFLLFPPFPPNLVHLQVFFGWASFGFFLWPGFVLQNLLRHIQGTPNASSPCFLSMLEVGWVQRPPPLWSGEHESSFISQMSIYLLNLWTISIKIEFDNTSGPRKLTN